MTVQETFSARLGVLMKGAKATQQDLAAAVGTTRQAVSQYIKGLAQPSIEKLYKIAEFFCVSADWLIGRKTARPESANESKARIAETSQAFLTVCEWFKNTCNDNQRIVIDMNGVTILSDDTFIPLDYICDKAHERLSCEVQHRGSSRK